MAQNIEIKTPIASISTVENQLVELAAEKVWNREQCDTFFDVPRGWLKLRESSDCKPELIAYTRSVEDAGPRLSDYELMPLDDPELCKRLLSRVLEVGSVVKKSRTLWMWKQTRIHLDEVEGLGTYLELEAVARDISVDEATLQADHLIEVLGLDEADFISVPYKEMLAKRCFPDGEAES